MSRHIIHQLTVEIGVPSHVDRASIQAQAMLFLEDIIFPQLEKWLDEMDQSEQIWQFEEIEIPVFETDFLDQENYVFEHLKRAMTPILIEKMAEQKLNYDQLAPITNTPRALEAWLFFFKNGRLPWFFLAKNAADSTVDFLETCRAASDFDVSFLEKIFQNPTMRKRFLTHFGREVVIESLGIYSKSSVFNPVFLKISPFKPDFLGKMTDAQFENWWLEIDFSDGAPIFLESKNYPNLPQKSVVQKPDITQKVAESDQFESEFVQNGGLVLLAFYLPLLFKNLERADEIGQLLDKSRAVHLVHFLATGRENAAEYDLVFEKLLCGMPFENVLEKPILPLSNTEKTECENLLRAVIQHWSMLKNTSLDGLRSAFLQRGGHLKLDENGWHLYLERTGLDVLLDYLPWTISVIKLPWMPEKLRVDWSN